MEAIEVPYTQLLQLVITRGKTPDDCVKRLIVMEELCRAFFEKHVKLPEGVMELQKYVHSEHTEWYEVLCKITERLKATEEGKRVNFIGQYSYEPLYDADKMWREFQKNNLHITSYNQLLQKQMTYNIPSIKKSIEYANKELSDYKTRQTESIRKLNANATEFKNRLKSYDMNSDDYPFKEDFSVHLKFRLIESIVAKNADVSIENYRKTLELLHVIKAEVIPVFKAFVKFQRIKKLYNESETMKHIDHAVEHGLEDINAGQQESASEVSVDQTEKQEEENISVIQVVKETDDVPIAEDKRKLLFSSNLGNPTFRQLLLGEVLELRSFVRIRIQELQNKPDMANYIFSQSGENVSEHIKKPISQYEKYLEMINQVIGGLSGTAATRALSILKNKSELEKAAKAEMDVWSRCCKEVAEQAELDKRIGTITIELQKLSADLEAARGLVKETRIKLEKAVSEVLANPVKVFGEIDNI